MSVVAAAIIGGAVVGGVASYATGKAASKEARKGAETAAGATVASTQMQVDEIRRQFDYQAQVLYPRLQQQYAASGAFSDLLGIGQNNAVGSSNFNASAPGAIYTSNGEPAVNPQTGQPLRTGGMTPSPGARPGGPGGQVPGRQMLQTDQYGNYIDSGGASIDPNQAGWLTPQQTAQKPPGMSDFDYAVQIGAVDPNTVAGGGRTGMINTGGDVMAGIPTPQAPPPGSTGFNRNERGAFIDPNVDPLSLEANQRLEGQVANTLLAGTPFEEDIYNRQVEENQIAAGTLGESNLMRNVQDTALFTQGETSKRRSFAEENQIFGDTFEESPGYQFQVEEMQRQQDRRRSAGGGTLGARGQIELARRQQGMAAGEYYNWAAGRDRDLGRIERGFDEEYSREATQAGRTDEATRLYEGQRTADVGRGDVAMENYLGRRAGDASRMDAAVGETDRLRGVDLQRRDVAYQNYLANLRSQAGFGDVAAQAVSSSQAAGGAVAGAYGQQGSQLSGIYNTLGRTQAGIAQTTGTNIGNAVQQGIGNYMFYDYMNKNPVGSGTGVVT